MDTQRNIHLIVIHCTASPLHTSLTPQMLERQHRANGWNSCGYHYYITKDGQTHPMRDINLMGAHTKGYNTGSIGIAYEGGLDKNGLPADTRTPEQVESIHTLLLKLILSFPITQIKGHRDLSPDLNGNGIIEPHEYIKQCPCFNAQEEYNHLLTHNPT